MTSWQHSTFSDYLITAAQRLWKWPRQFWMQKAAGGMCEECRTSPGQLMPRWRQTCTWCLTRFRRDSTLLQRRPLQWLWHLWHSLFIVESTDCLCFCFTLCMFIKDFCAEGIYWFVSIWNHLKPGSHKWQVPFPSLVPFSPPNILKHRIHVWREMVSRICDWYLNWISFIEPDRQVCLATATARQHQAVRGLRIQLVRTCHVYPQTSLQDSWM